MRKKVRNFLILCSLITMIFNFSFIGSVSSAVVSHKDLTGADLHIPKTHVSSHIGGGSDTLSGAGSLGNIEADSLTLGVDEKIYFNAGTEYLYWDSVIHDYILTDDLYLFQDGEHPGLVLSDGTIGYAIHLHPQTEYPFGIWYGTIDGDGGFNISGSYPLMYADTDNVYFPKGNVAFSHYLSGDGDDEGIFVDSAGKVGIGTATPVTTLDIDSNSNTQSLRLRGANGAVEIADMYVGSLTGNLILDTTAGTGTLACIEMRPEDDEFGFVIRESDGTGTSVFSNMYVVDAAKDYLNITINTGASTPGLVITEDEYVGIGTTTPTAGLHIFSSQLGLKAFPQFIIEDTTDYGRYTFQQQTTAGYANQYLSLKAEGSGTSFDNVMVWSAKTGNIGIQDVTPDATLDVNQSSSTAAIPVLELEQTDIDQDMIKFIGTSTTDNSQTLVDAVDLPTAGSIVGWIKVYIQDDQATNPIADGVYYIPFYSTPTSP